MTIELKTRFLGFEIGSKTLNPTITPPIRIQTGKDKDRAYIKKISVKNEDSVRVDEFVEIKEISFFPSWVIGVTYPIGEKFLSKDEINNETILRKRFFGIVERGIIWKP
ncbi:MAG: hypothetical protein ACD_50C00064G0005 [uncultured bacterium]|nr:MAG: hypothetical protein ACD_50C00064G0005 [uncultured bacterium]